MFTIPAKSYQNLNDKKFYHKYALKSTAKTQNNK